MASIDLLTNAEWLSVAHQRVRADGDGTAASDLHFVRATPAAEHGEYGGFIGDALPVSVRVTTSDESELDLAFFMKAVPNDSEKHAELAVMSGAFRKETGLYDEVFPRMRRFQSSKEKNRIVPCCPEVYFTRPDVIVMENLIDQGFVERDRRDPFDFDHVALVLEVLARFHASSFLLEEELSRETGNPSPLNELYPDLTKENIFLRDASAILSKWYECTIKTLQNAVALIPIYRNSSEYKTIVNKIRDVCYKHCDSLMTSSKYRNFLNHGDLWSNNILFRYENGRPIDCRLVDFQLCRYCPPAVDILQLFHLTTREPLRRKHGAALLRRYHETLADALALGGVEDVSRVLPWRELVASCDELRVTGLVTAAAYQHLSLATPERLKACMTAEHYETLIYGDRDELVAACFEDDGFYRERFGEQLSEVVDVEVLGKDQGFWERVVADSCL